METRSSLGLAGSEFLYEADDPTFTLPVHTMIAQLCGGETGARHCTSLSLAFFFPLVHNYLCYFDVTVTVK